MPRLQINLRMIGIPKGRSKSPTQFSDENDAREREARLSAALDKSLDPFMIHSAIRDRSGRIVDFRIEYVNEAMARFNGTPAIEQAGRSLLELFPAVRETGRFEKYVRVVETGEPLTLESVTYENEKAAAGPVRLVIDVRAVKLGDGCVVTGHDITARACAEMALRESEVGYRTLVEQSGDGILVSDNEGRYVEANPAICRMLGYSRDEFLATYTPSHIAADSPLSLGDIDERLAATQAGTGLLVERQYRRKDGTRVPAEVSFVRLPDGHLLRSVRDITVRKAAELHLAQMEGRYRGLLEAAPDAMVVVDQGGEIVLLNVQAEKQFGYLRDELVGQPVKNIIPEGFAERLIADGTRSSAEALAQQIGTGIELSGRRKDGSEFPIEIMLSPLESAEGILVTAAIRDITVRKAAETALQRTSKLLGASQSMARVGGWEMDPVGDTMFWTDETYCIHDTSPADYKPAVASALQFYAPESIPIVAAAMEDAIGSGTPFDLELELITAAGRRIWVHNKSTVTIDQGRTVKITGVLQDITEQRGLEAQLRQSQRLEVVGQLAGGIAHDFNNLLTAIRGYAELVRRDLGPDDQNRADLDQVVRAADRAVELTGQLLAFSRRQVLQPRVLDAAELVTGVAPMLRRLLGEHIVLATHFAADLGRVMVDPSQFEQVIVNLAVNARDAMPDGGELTIEIADVELDSAYAATHADVIPGPHVAIIVSDTGTGMEEAVKVHIYEPFFTTKAPGEGTGMGLATVYGIVQQSGGSIYLYTEPGHGTTFKIYLPRVADEATEDITTVPTAAAPTGSETILLVEDEAAVRSYAARVLSERGYTVLQAASGAEALAVASRSGSIDLLVTDVVMPGLQGHQLGKRLSEVRRDLRILYISGFTENSVVHHGVVGDGISFLQKPFSGEALGWAVRHLLDKPA